MCQQLKVQEETHLKVISPPLNDRQTFKTTYSSQIICQLILPISIKILEIFTNKDKTIHVTKNRSLWYEING